MNVDVDNSMEYLSVPLDALCSVLPRPWILTGALRDILIRHFYEENRIEHPELKRLLWRGVEPTNILIESHHRWTPQQTQTRPAIIIRRNEESNQRLGIDDRHQLPGPDLYGVEHYSTFWVGSHTLFCIGGSGIQSEFLAAEVKLELSRFAPILRPALHLHRFQVVKVGPSKPLKEWRDSWVVPVTVGYAYEDRWRLEPQTPKLARVSLNLVAAM